jgi:hypothetical protein
MTAIFKMIKRNKTICVPVIQTLLSLLTDFTRTETKLSFPNFNLLEHGKCKTGFCDRIPGPAEKKLREIQQIRSV